MATVTLSITLEQSQLLSVAGQTASLGIAGHGPRGGDDRHQAPENGHERFGS